MCNVENRLREVEAHLSMVVNYGLQDIPDEIDRNHIIDALTEARCALRELADAPRAALIETIAHEAVQ